MIHFSKRYRPEIGMQLSILLAMLLLAAPASRAGELLSRAAIAGDLEAVKARIACGDGVNDYDKWGWTALTWAVYNGNTPVVLWLLDHGADPNLKTIKAYGNFLAGEPPITLAAYYGHHRALEALLKKGADPEVANRKGAKALDYAREFDFEKCIALLEAKAAARP